MPRVLVHLPEDTTHAELLRTHGLRYEGAGWTARMCAVRVRALRSQLGPDVRMDPPPDNATPTQ